MRTIYKSQHTKGSLGDMAAEWWGEKEWEDWRLYVDDLKKSGEYGKEYELTWDLEHCPALDDPQPLSQNSTYSFIIFEL